MYYRNKFFYIQYSAKFSTIFYIVLIDFNSRIGKKNLISKAYPI